MIAVRSQRQEDGRLFLQSPYDKQFVEIAHTLPGLHWDGDKRVWIGYPDSVGLLGQRLAEAKVGKIVGDGHPIVRIMSYPSLAPIRPSQKIGADFLCAVANEGALLADSMGIGKSRQAILALHHLELPAVIICPSIVKNEWVTEGNHWGINVLSLSSVKPPNASLSKSDGIVVINYDIVHAWYEVLRSAKTIIFDEAQALSNSRSRRSQVCKEIAKATKNRIALTGTPFDNKLIDLWNLVDTISPGRFGSYVSYGKRYCGGFQEEIELKNKEVKKVWNFKGSSHVDELSLRLKEFMLRRTQSQVALELPEKTRKVVEVDVAKKEIGNLDVRDFDAEWLRWALSVSAEAKVSKAVELVALYLQNQSSIVVAAYHHRIADELQRGLANAGIAAFMATGEQTVTKRLQEIEKASQERPSVLIVTTHSVGQGINKLTFADVVVIVELDYSPKWILQFEGRFHRPGQKRNVLLSYMVGLGSIDEIIRDRVIGKLGLMEQTLGPMDDTMKEDLMGASDKDILDELANALREM